MRPVDKHYRKMMRSPALAFGTSFAAAMGLCAYGGYKLDQKLGTQDRWVLIGVLVGFLYGGYELWKIVRLNEEQEKVETHSSGPGKGEGGPTEPSGSE